ncbi:hypothetical protein HaLaN_19353 [Haematococcus lacustris]|uniref:Uncharacterized protein n=1 Tax=Haematococcus lacustris TaxID=44745 RepID=A0A699ZI67_HAELA|nr:hypothetical protein HaLaN_19353 [Haematococcus lacustris]
MAPSEVVLVATPSKGSCPRQGVPRPGHHEGCQTEHPKPQPSSLQHMRYRRSRTPRGGGRPSSLTADGLSGVSHHTSHIKACVSGLGHCIPWAWCTTLQPSANTHAQLSQLPLQLYWLRAACKFWNTAKLSHSDLLMRVIKANVELGRSCQTTWSAQFQLAVKELMGGEFTLSPDMVLGTKAMEVKWLERWGRRWVGFEGDPRLPETVHRERCSKSRTPRGGGRPSSLTADGLSGVSHIIMPTSIALSSTGGKDRKLGIDAVQITTEGELCTVKPGMSSLG